ncbi:MAG: hypothetical protein Q4G68_00465 [Planctomycetia bacterium]|nr:hypothetical protein [Planctomycetia bacterium]
MRCFRVLFVLSMFFAGALGCNKEQVPEGFPALAPCTITVTRAGTPQEGITVTLAPPQGNSPLAVAGKTNSQGVAKLNTIQGNYMQAGVPQGTYKVLVRKDIPFESKELSREEMKAMSAQELTAFEKEQEEARVQYEAERAKIVPPILSQPSSTPLTLDVNASGTSMTIDLSDYAK